MRRHLLDLTVLLVLATVSCAYVALAQPGVRNYAISVYLFVVGALVMIVIVSAFGDALPRRRRSAFEEALASAEHRERAPAQVEQIERVVTLGVANAYDLHRRLVPHLREIAQCRLERAGRTASPETLGRWWELLRPDRAEPDDRFGPGISQSELRALVSDLERM
ncbi:MAG TPA: hypothetical protein VF327_13465 [Gaiellaceae bacterium]